MSVLDIADLSVITVEGKTLAVDSLSKEARVLVDVYNSFRKDEAGQRLELKKVQAAMTMVSHEIVAQIKSEEDGEEKENVDPHMEPYPEANE